MDKQRILVVDDDPDAVCALMKDHLCDGWFIWLARINPITV